MHYSPSEILPRGTVPSRVVFPLFRNRTSGRGGCHFRRAIKKKKWQRRKEPRWVIQRGNESFVCTVSIWRLPWIRVLLLYTYVIVAMDKRMKGSLLPLATWCSWKESPNGCKVGGKKSPHHGRDRVNALSSPAARFLYALPLFRLDPDRSSS